MCWYGSSSQWCWPFFQTLNFKNMFYRNNSRSQSQLTSCNFYLTEDESPVQNGLAMTPSQMADMVARGIPVSTQANSQLWFDGTPNPSWEMPIDLQRGIDVNDVWIASMDAKDKLAKFKKNRKSSAKKGVE